MNLIELDQHLEALTCYLKRQGGQSIVPGANKWRSYRVCELVEAVELARKQTKKIGTRRTEQQAYEDDTLVSKAEVSKSVSTEKVDP